MPALLRELGRYGRDAFEVDVVTATPIEHRERALGRIAPNALPSDLRHIEAPFTVPGVLEGLEPQGYDQIVILASEWHDEAAQADASTAFCYAMLKGLFRDGEKRPNLLVELLDEQNRFLFPLEWEDLIVSPLIVSYLLSQVALRRELAAIFAELTRPWGPQIVLQPAEAYGAVEDALGFEAIERAAFGRGEIALGVRRLEGPDAGTVLNPERGVPLALSRGDEVAILASLAQRDEEA